MLTQTFIKLGSVLEHETKLTNSMIEPITFKITKFWSFCLIVNNLLLTIKLYRYFKTKHQMIKVIMLNPLDLIKYLLLLLASMIIIGAVFIFNLLAHNSFTANYLIIVTTLMSVSTLCLHQLFYYYLVNLTKERLKIYQRFSLIKIETWLTLIKQSSLIILKHPSYSKLTIEHLNFKIDHRCDQYQFMTVWTYHWWLLIPILNYLFLIIQQHQLNQKAQHYLNQKLSWLPLFIDCLIWSLICLTLSCWTVGLISNDFNGSTFVNIVIIVVMILLMLIINDYLIYYYVYQIENVFSYYLYKDNNLLDEANLQ